MSLDLCVSVNRPVFAEKLKETAESELCNIISEPEVRATITEWDDGKECTSLANYDLRLRDSLTVLTFEIQGSSRVPVEVVYVTDQSGGPEFGIAVRYSAASKLCIAALAAVAIAVADLGQGLISDESCIWGGSQEFTTPNAFRSLVNDRHYRSN
ncbi:MAG: hypothetical protein R3C28_33860 [Pirellulaceae bacterium]